MHHPDTPEMPDTATVAAWLYQKRVTSQDWWMSAIGDFTSEELHDIALAARVCDAERAGRLLISAIDASIRSACEDDAESPLTVKDYIEHCRQEYEDGKTFHQIP